MKSIIIFNYFNIRTRKSRTFLNELDKLCRKYAEEDDYDFSFEDEDYGGEE